MASEIEFKNITTPNGALKHMFITGEGKLNYDGDGHVYSGCVEVSKEDAKAYDKKITKFFNEHKPANYAGDKPDNKIIKKQEDGTYLLSFKCPLVNSKGVANHVKILDGKKVERPLPEGVNIGNGSLGCISGSMFVYTKGKGAKVKAGVSFLLNNVQILKFIPYVHDDGFKEQEGEFEGYDPDAFPDTTSKGDDEPKKKKKKKKKKSKEE
jgi:hypothetical protein